MSQWGRFSLTHNDSDGLVGEAHILKPFVGKEIQYSDEDKEYKYQEGAAA